MKKKALVKIKTPTIMKIVLPPQEKVEAALKSSNGLITYAARDLGLPLEVLKKQIKKNKFLRSLLIELRETMVDLAEDTLAWRMREKRDGIAAMFVAKCLGKSRGYVEKPEGKTGSSANQPVYIRILPVGQDVKQGPGRPRKIYAEAKVLPQKTEEEEVIDLEAL